MSSTRCYLDGEWLALAEARVSPLDRGFLFGDGVYEVIPGYGGRPFLLDRHLRRLQAGFAAIGLEAGGIDFAAIVDGLLAGETGDRAVYLQVTRGAAGQRDHRFPADVAPTVFAYPLAMPAPVDADHAGIAAITREDIRWARCDVKSVSLLGNVLLRQAAEAAGVAEAILLRDGVATEASASNLFAVLDGEVVTPPLGPALLPGITRGLVLEFARAEGLTVAEREIPAAALAHADELWLTSSTKEMLPVTRLDGRLVGEADRPGAVWRQLRAAFDRYKRDFRQRGNAAEAGS